jgi:hypothetical protein
MTKSLTLLACLASLVSLATSACGGATAMMPGRFVVGGQSVRLLGDVAAGYATFHTELDGWGRWASDSLHGVHWCPTSAGQAAFQPYRTDGRWEQAQEGAPAYGANPGTPVWHTTSGAAWEEITLHHGWWAQPDEEPQGTWCWVPGAEATPARVVWREGDGFVGWAPEPTDGDYCQADENGLSWTYELLAALFENALDPQVLTGDAANQAAESTTAQGQPARHSGPSASQVGRARQSVAAYLRTLTPPKEYASVAANTTGAGSQSAGSQGAAGAGSTKSGSSKSSETTTVKVAVVRTTLFDDDGLPPAAFLYASLVRQPMTTTTDATPRFFAPGSEPSRVASYGGTWSGGGHTSSAVGSSSSAFGHESFSSYHPSSSYGSSASSYHPSSSYGSSSHSSSSSSSSHSSSSHSSSSSSSSHSSSSHGHR